MFFDDDNSFAQSGLSEDDGYGAAMDCELLTAHASQDLKGLMISEYEYVLKQGALEPNIKQQSGIDDNFRCNDPNCPRPQCRKTFSFLNEMAAAKKDTEPHCYFTRKWKPEAYTTQANVRCYHANQQTNILFTTMEDGFVLQKNPMVPNAIKIPVGTICINGTPLRLFDADKIADLLGIDCLDFHGTLTKSSELYTELAVGSVLTLIIKGKTELLAHNEIVTSTETPFSSGGLCIFVSGDGQQVNAKFVPPGSNESIASFAPKEFDKSTEEGKKAARDGTDKTSHCYIIVIPCKLTMSTDDSIFLCDYWKGNSTLLPAMQESIKKKLLDPILELVKLGETTKKSSIINETSSSTPISQTSFSADVDDVAARRVTPRTRSIGSPGQPQYRSLSALAMDETEETEETEEKKVNIYPVLEFTQANPGPPTTMFPERLLRPTVSKKGVVLPYATNDDGTFATLPLSLSRDAEPIKVFQLMIAQENDKLADQLDVPSPRKAGMRPTFDAMEREMNAMGEPFGELDIAQILEQNKALRDLHTLHFEDTVLPDSDLVPDSNSQGIIITCVKCCVCMDKIVKKMPSTCLHVCVCDECKSHDKTNILRSCPICRSDASIWLDYTALTLLELASENKVPILAGYIADPE